MERKVQERLIKYLKKKGCYVIKTKPGVGTPVGCPDILALYEGLWLAFEIKAHEKSPFSPLQKDTIRKLDDWSLCKVVHSGNIEAIVADLEKLL